MSRRAAGRLTALFAWARFSVHDVRPEMKDEAIETLEQVQHELAAADAARGRARGSAGVKRIDRAIAASGSPSTAWAGIVLCSCPAAPRSSLTSGSSLVLAIGLAAAVGALRRAVPTRPSTFDAAFAPRRRTRARPASLERVEREVALATRHGVRRPLPAPAAGPAPIASGLLVRRGVDLERGSRAGADARRPERGSSSGPTARRPTTALRPASRSRRSSAPWTSWSGSHGAERSSRARCGGARRGRAGGRRQARPARARPRRPPRGRPRAARGRPRAREDADGAVVRDRDRASGSRASSSRPTSCRPTSRARRSGTSASSSSSSARAPSSRTSSSPTRSTAPRRRPRRRCSRRCRSARCRSTGRRTRCRAAVPRARDAEPDRVRGHVPAAGGAARSVRAAHRLRLPVRRRRVGDARAAPRRGATRSSSGRWSTARRSSRCSAPSRTCTSTRASAATSSTSSRRRARAPASPSARARAARSRSSSSRAAGRRCAGRDFVTPDDVKSARGARALAPPRPPPRALGAAADRRGRRARGPRRGPDAEHRARVTRSADARLGAYAAARRRCVGRRARAPAARARGARRAVRAARRARRPDAVACPPGLGRHRPRAGARGRRARRDRHRAGRHRDRPARDRARAPAGPRARRGGEPGCYHLAAGEERELPLRVRCVRWMSTEVGEVWLRARDRRVSCASKAASTGANRCGSTPRPSGSAASSRPPGRRLPPGARCRRCAPRASSSPTSARSFPAIACGRSTGARRRVAAASS